MAVVPEKTANFASFSGTPDSNSAYNDLEFGFKSIAVKIIVSAGSLEVSVNKSDATPHMILPTGQYDFHGLAKSKLYVRNTTGAFQLFTWTD